MIKKKILEFFMNINLVGHVLIHIFIILNILTTSRVLYICQKEPLNNAMDLIQVQPNFDYQYVIIPLLTTGIYYNNK